MKSIKLIASVLAILTLCGCLASDPGTTGPVVVYSQDLPSSADPVTQPAATPAPGDYVFSADNFPRMDGSTSQVPLAQAVVSALLGLSAGEAEAFVAFNRTTQSFRNLMWDYCDILIAAEPPDSIWDEYAQNGFECEIANIANDALIFVVNEDNPVQSLTIDQVRGIYSGQITTWSQVGGNDETIIPFQRNSEAGSQAAMLRLVMDDGTMMEPPVDYVVDSMMGLMEAVKSFDGSAGAIGYSVYYYASDMRMAEGLKIIAIDGVEPDADTIRGGSYSLLVPSYAVISADEPGDSPARMLFAWLQSQSGQDLIESMGYVPAVSELKFSNVYTYGSVPTAAAVEEVGSRLSDGPLAALTPSGSYGMLLPYLGEQLYSSIDGYGLGGKYGLVTSGGMVVVDPVYSTVYQVSWYDGATGTNDYFDLLVLGTAEPDGSEMGYGEKYALAALDGSWITGFDYENAAACELGVVMSRSGGSLDAVCYGEDGEILFDTAGWDLGALPEYTWLDFYGMSDGYICSSGGEGIVFDIRGNRYDLPEVTQMGSFFNGFAPACNSAGLWGYIGTDLEWAIQPAYLDAAMFYCDYAAVTLSGGGSAIIDRQGNIVKTPGDGVLYYAGYGLEPYFAYTPSGSGETQYFSSALEPLTEERVSTGGISGVEYMISNSGEYASFLMTDGTYGVYALGGREILRSKGLLQLYPDTVTGEISIYESLSSGNGSLGIFYNIQGVPIVTGATWGIPSGGLFPCGNNIYTGYKNSNNQWVFKTLITDAGD